MPVRSVSRVDTGYPEPPADDEEDLVLIDCDSCSVRGPACADCVVTVLLGSAPAGVELDPTEQAAISALAQHGLVPPLRLVTSPSASASASDPGPDSRAAAC